MKVLIDSSGPPYFLAHGGAQTQVMQTVSGLRDIGVEVEFARWWDDKQTADLIHFYGMPRLGYIHFARAKRLPFVCTTLFTSTCNRTPLQLALQGSMISTLLKIPAVPIWRSIRGQLNWESFRKCDMNIVGLEAEARVLERVYGLTRNQIGIVPLGLSEPFHQAGHGTRQHSYLITTGTITERKRSMELAKMAHLTKVPICFVGKPYDVTSAYWREFQSLVDGTIVTHVPHTESINEMIELLQGARGYVLFSDYENWCLSAHEAIACGLPILVPDQPWSREIFGAHARYFSGWDIARNSRILSDFHSKCDSIPTPNIKLYSWKDVATKLRSIYESLLSQSGR